MNVAMATLWTDEISRYAKVSAAQKERYCRIHKITYRGVGYSLESSRHPSWSKIVLVRELLHSHDWVFWTDADAFIVVPDRDLRIYLDVPDNVFFVTCWDCDGSPDKVCMGHFAVKNSPMGFKLLDTLWNHDGYHLEHPWEQRVMTDILMNDAAIRQGTWVYPTRVWNENRWQLDDEVFIHHALGCPDDKEWRVINGCSIIEGRLRRAEGEPVGLGMMYGEGIKMAR